LAFDDLQLASRALHDLVRIGYPEAAREALATLATRVEGELVATQARHAAAAVARDGRLLGKVGADFRAMGAMLLAAEAYSDAAVALRTEGDPKRAATFAHTAGTLLTECEGASTPAVQPLNVRAQLTPAERSTAMLAAQGWSNKDIAATEHVSVRTVESRLQVAYSKLGISSRKELAEHLAGQIADL
jgi:DNA-binding NarL/FixJ family response regulator